MNLIRFVLKCLVDIRMILNCYVVVSLLAVTPPPHTHTQQLWGFHIDIVHCLPSYPILNNHKLPNLYSNSNLVEILILTPN